MIVEEKKQKSRLAEEKITSHKLALDERERLSVTGVLNVEGFSETMVTLDTSMGRMVIKGENLHMNKLDVVDGGFSLEGKVNAFEYQKKSGKKGNFWENLFK